MPEHSDQTLQRLANLDALVEAGFERYPYQYPVSHSAKAVLEAHRGAAAEQDWPSQLISLAGRLMAIRRMGKVSFGHLQDGSAKIQVYFSRDLTEQYEALKKLDVGDIIGVLGTAFTTKTGEITLKVASWKPLVKSLHPLPDKWHGIKEKEVRYRQRYLDLIQSPAVREVFRTRSKIVSYIRRFLEGEAFLEVETPVIQTIAGGTEARPFQTHHNALSSDFFLRIALELHLKRLLVGGFEKVFEIGRVFRNEGIDHNHNPEFTMLEAYWAYADYAQMAELVERMVSSMVKEFTGGYHINFQGRDIDFSPPFKRIDYTESLRAKAALDFDPLEVERLRLWSDAKHPEFKDVPTYKLLDKLFGVYVEPDLIQPTFVLDFPLAISPLAKKHRGKPGLTERWDFFIAGMEIAPAYSELNDALDQRERFEEQVRRRAAGDAEEPEQDEDFLTALEYGMPPAAGLGFGIDRFTMILTNQESIRDVILFPLLKPRKPGQEEAEEPC